MILWEQVQDFCIKITIMSNIFILSKIIQKYVKMFKPIIIMRIKYKCKLKIKMKLLKRKEVNFAKLTVELIKIILKKVKKNLGTNSKFMTQIKAYYNKGILYLKKNKIIKIAIRFQNELLSNAYEQKVNFHCYSYQIAIFQEQLLFLKSSWQKNQQFQTKIKVKNNKMSKMINLTQDAINALNIQIQKLTLSYKQNKHQKNQKNILALKKFDQRLERQKQKLSLYQNYQYLQNQYQDKIQIKKQVSLIVEQTKKINNLNKVILQKIQQKQKTLAQKYQKKQKIMNVKKNLRYQIKQTSQKIKQCDYEQFQISQNIDKLSQSKEHIQNQIKQLQNKNYQIHRMYEQIQNLTNQYLHLQNQKKICNYFIKELKNKKRKCSKQLKFKNNVKQKKRSINNKRTSLMQKVNLMSKVSLMQKASLMQWRKTSLMQWWKAINKVLQAKIQIKLKSKGKIKYNYKSNKDKILKFGNLCSVTNKQRNILMNFID